MNKSVIILVMTIFLLAMSLCGCKKNVDIESTEDTTIINVEEMIQETVSEETMNNMDSLDSIEVTESTEEARPEQPEKNPGEKKPPATEPPATEPPATNAPAVEPESPDISGETAED